MFVGESMMCSGYTYCVSVVLMKRKGIITGIIGVALALTACGTSESEPADTPEPSPINELSDIEERLTGTEHECYEWEQTAVDRASCTIMGHGKQHIWEHDDTEMVAAVHMDQGIGASGAALTDDWVMLCTVGADDCEAMASILDAEFVTYGHWSD